MWMTLLASGFQSFASIRADDAVSSSQAEASAQASNAGDAVADAAANAQTGEIGSEIPTAEQLLAVLDSMSGLSEEEKASIREELTKGGGGAGASPAVSGDITMQALILFSLLALVALIFVFFVFKLFRCLQERERKREEKKKNKQLKKKK